MSILFQGFSWHFPQKCTFSSSHLHNWCLQPVCTFGILDFIVGNDTGLNFAATFMDIQCMWYLLLI